MENEKDLLNSESGEENVNDSIDYIEAIKEMKQNSVSKESYEKVKQENKKHYEWATGSCVEASGLGRGSGISIV